MHFLRPKVRVAGYLLFLFACVWFRWPAATSLSLQVVPAAAAAGPTLATAARGLTFAQPLEQDLRQGTVGLLRTGRWWYRKIYNTVHHAVRSWWQWLVRAAFFLAIALAASMLDGNLWRQLRSQGWGALRAYIPRGALVYVLTAFDRRADRFGQGVLLGALVYGIVPWDLVPDRGLSAGIAEDVVLVAAASRWFMTRCSSEVIEQHARAVEAWRVRTHEIRARRRRVRDSADLSA